VQAESAAAAGAGGASAGAGAAADNGKSEVSHLSCNTQGVSVFKRSPGQDCAAHGPSSTCVAQAGVWCGRDTGGCSGLVERSLTDQLQ
jgi:hypothetical protein